MEGRDSQPPPYQNSFYCYFIRNLQYSQHASTPRPVRSENARKRSRPGSDCEVCPQCETQIKPEVDHLVCIHCGLSFCISCTSISKKQFDLISTPGLNLSWTCPTCRYTLPTLLRLDSSLADIKKNNDERLTKLELDMAEMDIKLEAKLETCTNEKLVKIKQDIEKSLTDHLDRKIDMRIREHDDRKTRSSNLMVYNLPESNNTIPKERKLSDESLIKQIATNLGIEIDMLNGFRIGTKTPGKLRPYKIILDSKKTRRDLLINAKYIKDKVSSDLKNVIITADLTPTQREERKILMKELENARKEFPGAKIRDGKIIKPKDVSGKKINKTNK